ncbi:MAG: type IV secretion system protein VirB3 [Candidatus Methylumidiphilus sp.]
MWQPEQKVAVTVDPLFVGLTRPATIFGIPYEAFVVEFVLVAIVFLGVGDIFYLLLIVPLHGVLYLVGGQNHAVFGSLRAWTMTKGRCMNTRFWGARQAFRRWPPKSGSSEAFA